MTAGDTNTDDNTHTVSNSPTACSPRTRSAAPPINTTAGAVWITMNITSRNANRARRRSEESSNALTKIPSGIDSTASTNPARIPIPCTDRLYCGPGVGSVRIV